MIWFNLSVGTKIDEPCTKGAPIQLVITKSDDPRNMVDGFFLYGHQ